MAEKTDKKSDEKSESGSLRIFITFAAIIIAVAHLAFPNLTIDGVTLALLVIALLPWLAPIIKSIELPGGLKIELQELKAKIDEVGGLARNAEQQAEYAVAKTTSEDQQNLPAIDPDQEYKTLTQRYNEIRATQKSGDARTKNMTKVVSDMVSLVPRLKHFDIDEALKSTDGGVRISGYAFLYASPNISELGALVKALTRIEDKPFGHYWAIQALDKLLSERPPIDKHILAALRSFQSSILIPGTDRHYALGRILLDYEATP